MNPKIPEKPLKTHDTKISWGIPRAKIRIYKYAVGMLELRFERYLAYSDYHWDFFINDKFIGRILILRRSDRDYIFFSKYTDHKPGSLTDEIQQLESELFKSIYDFMDAYLCDILGILDDEIEEISKETLEPIGENLINYSQDIRLIDDETFLSNS